MAEQSGLLDQVLENMDDLELSARMKALAEEKQALLAQLDELRQEEQQIFRESRRQEMAAWLAQQPAVLTEYDDSLTRRWVERITVVDAENIRIRLKDADVEIKQKLC